jgi:hypothetical protein
MFFQFLKYFIFYLLLLFLDFYLVRYSGNRLSYISVRDYYFRDAFRLSGFVLGYTGFYFVGVLLGNLFMLEEELRFYIWLFYEFISGLHLGFLLGKLYLSYRFGNELAVRS